MDEAFWELRPEHDDSLYPRTVAGSQLDFFLEVCSASKSAPRNPVKDHGLVGIVTPSQMWHATASGIDDALQVFALEEINAGRADGDVVVVAVTVLDVVDDTPSRPLKRSQLFQGLTVAHHWRADYDSKADTLQIELEPVDRLDRDDASVAGVIVGICDGRPVMVDLIGTRTDIEGRLRAAAGRYDLDAEALIAAAQAALAAPDRTVTLDVALRTAA